MVVLSLEGRLAAPVPHAPPRTVDGGVMPGHQVGRAPVLARRRSSNRPSGAGARSADLLRPVPRAAIGVALILPGDGGHSKSIREETPVESSHGDPAAGRRPHG